MNPDEARIEFILAFALVGVGVLLSLTEGNIMDVQVASFIAVGRFMLASMFGTKGSI